MSAVVVRILLRYLAGALIAKGLISSDVGNAIIGDKDVTSLIEMALGGGVAVFSEGWYMAARRLGWAK